MTALLTLGLFCVGFYQEFLNAQFASNDLSRTHGVVDSVRSTYTPSVAIYRVSFHYFSDSTTYFAQQPVSAITASELQEGDAVPIKYFKNSPQTCRIDLQAEDMRYANMAEGLFLLGGLIGLACTYFIWVYRHWFIPIRGNSVIRPSDGAFYID
jgi:hypothetical protein